jgi:hypothetical protein
VHSKHKGRDAWLLQKASFWRPVHKEQLLSNIYYADDSFRNEIWIAKAMSLPFLGLPAPLPNLPGQKCFVR